MIVYLFSLKSQLNFNFFFKKKLYYLNTSHKCRVNDFKRITNVLKELYPNNIRSVIYECLHYSQEGGKKTNGI